MPVIRTKYYRTRGLNLVLKIAALAAFYLVITYYAMPVFLSVRDYVTERFMTNTKFIVIGETAVNVEIADTVDKQLQGLSGRQSLPPGNGMFFVFDEPGDYGIWMKDMLFNIDIVWFNQYGEVIHVVEHAEPSSYPETFFARSPSMFVLEVPAGFVKEKGIKLGDKIDFY